MSIELQKPYELIELQYEGDFATITMNNPKRRNALSLKHMLELTDAFRKVGESEAHGVFLAANVSRVGNLIEIAQKVINTFSGPLLGIYLLGMFTRRGTSIGALLGGALADRISAPVTVSMGAIAAIGGAAIFGVRLPKLRVEARRLPSVAILGDRIDVGAR